MLITILQVFASLLTSVFFHVLPRQLLRLEDFENSCAAYDKSCELSEDYLTYLNYAITLYTNDEIERARKQFAKFEVFFLFFLFSILSH